MFFVLAFVSGKCCCVCLLAFVFDCVFLTLFSVRSSWLLLWCVAISSYSLFVNIDLVLCSRVCSLFFMLIIMICYCSVPLDFYLLLI